MADPVVPRGQRRGPNELTALRFVLAFGAVSLLADLVYEGGRSIIGPFLGSLGATGATVGLVAGLGEATALTFRLVAGPLADRSRRFWAFTIAGYLLTLVSVPLIAVSGNLGVAVGLYLTERLGKAVRTPARDTMLAAAGQQMGRGWAFAVHESLDQVGAVLGPILVAVVVARSGSYDAGFSALAVPAAMTVAVLLWLRRAAPAPLAYDQTGESRTVEAPTQHAPSNEPLGGAFWHYLLFAALAVGGLAPFVLASYHAETQGLPPGRVPLLYAFAMAVDAVAALVGGRAYDRRGLGVLRVLPLLAMVVPLASFSDSVAWIWVGAGAWGAAIGMHESILRAAVADLAPSRRRATAYGIFTAFYGAASFAGDAVIGWLYDRTIGGIVAVTFVVEVLALVVLASSGRAGRPEPEWAGAGT